MSTTTTTKVTTKLNKDQAKGTETALTIEWDVDDAKVRELAQKSVVIQYQALVRAAGKVPTTDTVKVSELYAKRPRSAKAMTPDAIVAAAKSNPELLKALKELLDAQHKPGK